MLRVLLRRLLWMVPTLVGVTLVTFAVVRLLPGDAATTLFGGLEPGAGVDSATLERFRSQHLLDRSLPRQYLHWLGPFDLGPRGHAWFGGSGEEPWGGVLTGDLGRELLRPGVSIGGELARRLGVSVPLMAAAALLAYLLALPIGVLAAVRRGGWFDRASTFGLLALFALPTFSTAVFLQFALGPAGLDWLPVVGRAEPGSGLGGWLARSALPVVCLAYGGLAYLAQQSRSSLLEALGQDFVRTARAKGLRERRVVGVHALRNGLIPVLTLVGNVLPALVGGSVLVETVFDLPGIGRYAYESLLRREVGAIQATVLLSAVMTLFGFLLSDLLYAVADPRLRDA